VAQTNEFAELTELSYGLAQQRRVSEERDSDAVAARMRVGLSLTGSDDETL